jgi:hypothetical protein
MNMSNIPEEHWKNLNTSSNLNQNDEWIGFGQTYDKEDLGKSKVFEFKGNIDEIGIEDVPEDVVEALKRVLSAESVADITSCLKKEVAEGEDYLFIIDSLQSSSQEKRKRVKILIEVRPGKVPVPGTPTEE